MREHVCEILLGCLGRQIHMRAFRTSGGRRLLPLADSSALTPHDATVRCHAARPSESSALAMMPRCHAAAPQMPSLPLVASSPNAAVAGAAVPVPRCHSSSNDSSPPGRGATRLQMTRLHESVPRCRGAAFAHSNSKVRLAHSPRCDPLPRCRCAPNIHSKA